LAKTTTAQRSTAARTVSTLILKRYARQNHESGGAKCFVATPRDAPARILGFYTLSPASVEFSRAPAVVTRGLGRYEIPVYRLGRLGVDRTVQGRGLGGRLLLRAAERCMTAAQEVGGVALLIGAKSDPPCRTASHRSGH
jgi:GNAT superfamily N-acetyltransferase